MNKAEALLQAIRDCNVGDDIIVHNDDGSIFVILKLIARDTEHEEVA